MGATSLLLGGGLSFVGGVSSFVGGGLACGWWIRLRVVQVVRGWGADVRGRGVVVQAWGAAFSSCCCQAVSFVWLL